MSRRQLFKSLIFRSWWVIAFTLLCGILYERGMQKKESQFQQLKEQLVVLETEKKAALQKQKNLQLQINSQSDLAWIELILMKDLGLKPEEQQKIFFD